jgi:hypothetical protein
MINYIKIVIDNNSEEYIRQLRHAMQNRPDVDSDTKIEIVFGDKTTYYGENSEYAQTLQSNEELAKSLQEDAELEYTKLLLSQIPCPSDQFEVVAGDTDLDGKHVIYIYFPYLERTTGYYLDGDGKLQKL